MAHLAPISLKKTTTTAIYNHNLAKPASTVRLDSFRSHIVCLQPDGSSCPLFITAAVDESTGEVVYQSVDSNLMKSQEVVLFLNQTKKHLEQSGKALETVVVDLIPTYQNQGFIGSCTHSGIAVQFTPLMALNRAERYFQSLDMFLHSHTRVKTLDLEEASDFAHTYADQIYNSRRVV